MQFGVLGTGMVGETLATKLIQLGHEVKMGSRSASNEKAQAWAGRAGTGASIGTFGDAAAFGEILLTCTSGATSVDALASADPQDLEGKVLIDVSNPLDFSHGMPVQLSICNGDSLGETIQRRFPQLRVVKALNTVNCAVMVDPSRVPGDTDLFICGNDAGAKDSVKALLADFGWKSIIDLGDLTSARATEQLMPIWMRLYQMFGSADFNFKIVR